MEYFFWYKLTLSFLVGSAWITLSTIIAERYGSKIGGLIGGLPSTAFISLLFIGITQTPLVASEATTVIPLAQAFNGLFIIAYILLVRRGIGVGLMGALLVWFFLASSLLASGMIDFWISVIGWALLVLGCYLIVEKCMDVSSQGKVSVRYTSSQVIFRALFGVIVIVFSVFMGKIGGPVYGGVFATFPAVFLSTLLITYRTGGAKFSQAVAKSLMVSGMINVVIYAIAVRYLYIRTGLLYGTVIALAISAVSAYLTFMFMRAKLS
ncbi:MAG: DUF3147 family protein [Candidatus Bathyarchaeum sp.]|nr:MAG: DUF3147 family protein [Candidatus Bathyarchaeum sp.]